jgi:anti-sigma factor RsiW
MFARLSEWIDAELDEGSRQRMEGHLADCPACKVCLETLTRTAALCRGLDRSALPDQVIKRIKKEMKLEI